MRNNELFLKTLAEDISLLRLLPLLEKTASAERGLPVSRVTIYRALKVGPNTLLRRVIIDAACKVRDEARANLKAS